MAVNRPWFEFCAFLYTSTHCKLDHSCLERNWEGPWNSWLWEHLQNYVQASFRRDLYACCSEGLLGQWSVLKWYNIWVPLSDCHLSDTIRYFSDSNSENWLISHIVWGAIFVFRGTQICWGKAEYAVGERINSGIWRSVSKLKENIEALWSITLSNDLAKSWQCSDVIFRREIQEFSSSFSRSFTMWIVPAEDFGKLNLMYLVLSTIIICRNALVLEVIPR